MPFSSLVTDIQQERVQALFELQQRRWPTFMDFNLTESNCISPSKIIPLAIKVVFLSLVHDNVRSQSQTTVINIKPKVIQPGFSPVKKAFLSLIIEIYSNQLFLQDTQFSIAFYLPVFSNLLL